MAMGSFRIGVIPDLMDRWTPGTFSYIDPLHRRDAEGAEEKVSGWVMERVRSKATQTTSGVVLLQDCQSTGTAASD
jgi:hypothetical protein